MQGDPDLQGLSDPFGAIDEEIRRVGWANFACGIAKQNEPAGEVRARNVWNFGMSQHGLPLVAAAHQRDGGPERAHRFKVRRPVFNLGFEDRSQNSVVPHVRVKRMDEIADHWLGDTGGGAGRSGIWFTIEI